MLHIQEIETTEAWDAMNEHCTIEAQALVESQFIASRESVNAMPDLRERAKVQCASAVFEVLYGDLREDIKEMLLMLRLTHPDQVRVAQIEHKMSGKLGAMR